MLPRNNPVPFSSLRPLAYVENVEERIVEICKLHADADGLVDLDAVADMGNEDVLLALRSTNCLLFLLGLVDHSAAMKVQNRIRTDHLDVPNDALMALVRKPIEYWKAYVANAFSEPPAAMPGSGADHMTSDPRFQPPTITSLQAFCWPFTQNAGDYHWAYIKGQFLFEQAGRSGPLCIWDLKVVRLKDVLAQIRNRKDKVTGKFLYDEFFKFKISRK